MLNLKILSRAFDTERYVMQQCPDAQRSGGNLIVTCPVCEKPKLWVLITDRDDVRAPAWQCFSGDCGDAGRDALSLVQRLEELDTFHALERIVQYQKGNQPLIDLRKLVEDRLLGGGEVDSGPPPPVPLPDEFIPVEAGASRSDIPKYFRARGIGPKKAHRYGLGWCEEGYFKNRLIVPVTSKGEVVFFVARWMGKSKPQNGKKVVYPKGCRPSRYLYNYDRAKRCDTIRVVEGVLDAIHVGKSAVATFGTTLSQYQLELLMRSEARTIVFMWDRDAIDKARAQADRLSDLWTIKVVELPDERDPDEHSREDLLAMEQKATPLDTAGARRQYVLGRLGGI